MDYHPGLVNPQIPLLEARLNAIYETTVKTSVLQLKSSNALLHSDLLCYQAISFFFNFFFKSTIDNVDSNQNALCNSWLHLHHEVKYTF